VASNLPVKSPTYFISDEDGYECKLDSYSSGQRTVAGYSEHGNEPSGSISLRGGELPDRLAISIGRSEPNIVCVSPVVKIAFCWKIQKLLSDAVAT
jgi:hypothetical protein